MPWCSSLVAIWSMPNENTLAKPRSRETWSRGFGFEGACAKLTPIENASIKSDNAATCGGYQHHRRGNPPNLVAPLKDFIDIPPIDFNSKCILFAALRGQVGCHAGYLVTLGGL